MAWQLTPAHQAAREVAARAAANAQSIVHADGDSGNATLKIYGPEDAATSSRELLGTITLARPCGVLVTGRIQLAQADPAGDIVAATGYPEFAEWCASDGTVIGTCTASAEGGGGDLTIAGREDGQVFQGGFLVLQGGLIG